MMPLRALSLLSNLLLSGCAATAIMIGEGEPNFEQIRLGDTRPRVEGILGQREWQLGYANGLAYEIYQFKAGRPPDPLLGTAAYAFDFITLGLLEIGYRPNQLAPVKQIAVAYDANEHVRFISKPWPVKMFGACTRVRSTIPNDAGVPHAFESDLKNQPISTNAAPARLVLDRTVILDGNSVGNTTVELQPGHRKLSFRSFFPRRTSTFPVSLSFEAVSGHQYRLQVEEFWPYLMNFLIEDVNSKETLDCVEVRADQLPGWIEPK